MWKEFAIICFMVIIVRSAPQGRSDVELLEQTFNKINEAEYDYRYSLSDGHEQEQRRSDIKGIHTVVGFYKFVDPDGKSHQIYYKADDRGYQISYDKPFEIETESERLTDPSKSYLPPRENLISEIPETPGNSYLPPSNTYLPPN